MAGDQEKPRTHRYNIDANTRAIRFLSQGPHPSVYFESTDAFEQSEEGKAQNWSVWGIVEGRETTLHRSQKGAKRGSGSAIIYRSETGVLAVLPNDASRREAENVMTVDGARKLFEGDQVMMDKIRNALRTNIEHRKHKMLPKKKTLFVRPR